MLKTESFGWNWSYRPDHYCEETIQALSQSFINRLKEIVDYCTHKENFGYTTSDFSLIHISQSRLNQTFGAMKDIDRIYPLTPLQGGLLFQSLYAPESDAYFVQSVMEIKGTLHVESMKNAWLSLINHHPILRTGVLWEGLDTPLQYVLNTVAVPWEVLDWSQEEKKDRHHKLKAFIEADRRKSFDLSESLFRITLIKHSAHEHTLIWSHHHILTDGWSGSILKADLFKAYEAIRSNQEVWPHDVLIETTLLGFNAKTRQQQNPFGKKRSKILLNPRDFLLRICFLPLKRPTTLPIRLSFLKQKQRNCSNLQKHML